MNTPSIVPELADQPVQTYLSQPSATQLRLPAKACDTHVHVFGPTDRFPYAMARSHPPAQAPKEKLFALHQFLGIERCVIVQSVVHGLDNSVVADAIAAGRGNYLGVALVAVDASAQELQGLAQQGFRGVRFHFMPHLGASVDLNALIGLTHRLAEARMHLQVHFHPSLIDELSPWFKRSAVPVVIDHMARVDATQGLSGPAFQALCRLLDNALFHVKISGIDRVDEKLPLDTPPYPRGIELAHYLLREFPRQCLWGTDWPHPNHTHVPDDGVLVDALARIAPTPALMQQLLVDNPEALYRFEAFRWGASA
ncbi:MAG: amidohydrolase family protein [Hylemonella sp.]